MAEALQSLSSEVRGNLVLGGQPTEDELRIASERGFRTVINLRLPTEDFGFDEAELVEQLGMQYRNLGFKEAHELTDEIFDQARKLLVDPERAPLLLHCKSANRVGVIWLAHRVLDHGVNFGAALMEAVEVGLRTDSYVEKARDYVTRHALQSSRLVLLQKQLRRDAKPRSNTKPPVPPIPR